MEIKTLFYPGSLRKVMKIQDSSKGRNPEPRTAIPLPVFVQGVTTAHSFQR